jgi:hypothetical protein
MSHILNLKSSHKPIKLYYQELAKLKDQGYQNEGQVRKPFDILLDYYCRQFDWLLATEVTLKFNQKNIRPDGIIKRGIFQHGIYEAKDDQDKLQAEITKKFKQGYPKNNALFWSPERLINSLIDNIAFIAFDGMRKHLEEDFDQIYVLDLGGNVRKNPKLFGTTHNVFGIQVGVSINILVKKRG